MAATNGGPTSLVGKTFDCAFRPFVPRLTVLSQTELRVQATIGATQIDEAVKSDLTVVRPDLFIMSWTEQSGNFVVQFRITRTKSFIIMHGWPTGNCSVRRGSFSRHRRPDRVSHRTARTTRTVVRPLDEYRSTFPSI